MCAEECTYTVYTVYRYTRQVYRPVCPSQRGKLYLCLYLWQVTNGSRLATRGCGGVPPPGGGGGRGAWKTQPQNPLRPSPRKLCRFVCASHCELERPFLYFHRRWNVGEGRCVSTHVHVWVCVWGEGRCVSTHVCECVWGWGSVCEHTCVWVCVGVRVSVWARMCVSVCVGGRGGGDISSIYLQLHFCLLMWTALGLGK